MNQIYETDNILPINEDDDDAEDEDEHEGTDHSHQDPKGYLSFTTLHTV